MSEKRFFYKVYTSCEVEFFDNEQEYVNEKYTCDDVRGLHPMDYWEVVDLLNELNDENAKLLSKRIKDCEEFEECVNKVQSLKKENEKLQIQNKRLQNELNDCEKFRYYVFKRMGELK